MSQMEVVAGTPAANYPAGQKRDGTMDEKGRMRVNALADGQYETVAVSQTAQALGATGALGDYLEGVLIIPVTTSPGAVSIKDGGDTAIAIFDGGATSVGSLIPFFVPIGAVSRTGAWQITTGANVRAIGFGRFT